MDVVTYLVREAASEEPLKTNVIIKFIAKYALSRPGTLPQWCIGVTHNPFARLEKHGIILDDTSHHFIYLKADSKKNAKNVVNLLSYLGMKQGVIEGENDPFYVYAFKSNSLTRI